MIVADALAAYLDQRPPCDGQRVAGWRFEVAERTALRIGIRDSQLGGPYEGPGIARWLAGLLELHWSDGRLTRAQADRQALADPPSALAEWRSAALVPRHGALPPLPGPSVPPAVQTFDPSVSQAVYDEPARALGLLAQLGEDAGRSGAARVDAVLRVTVGRHAVRSSAGFVAGWDETAFSLQLWADELGSASYERRSWPSPADRDRLCVEATEQAHRLRVEVPVPTPAGGVLFAPAAVDALIGRFLLPNLNGRTIREGRSLFAQTDLDQRQRVLRDDLSLLVDTTLPFEMATAPCSPEGVRAGRVALIADGRLCRPLVDVEESQALGLPPTPRPRGRPFALLECAAPALTWDQALQALGHGVVVRALPGLHTQAVRRASYALVTPDAEAVVGGAVVGRCAVRLAGSLIDHVSQASSRVVRVSGVLGPGLLVFDGVGVTPA
ncbi:MAG: hypothetical protein IT306_00560 [Chloroflexi bacterium]|nr:hypothetical protein [Chloroflexota bacterium]